MDNETKSVISVALPTDLYNRFKKRCKKKYKSMSTVLRELVVGYVSYPKKENNHNENLQNLD